MLLESYVVGLLPRAPILTFPGGGKGLPITTRLRTGLPGAPILTFPREGKGLLFWVLSPGGGRFDAAPVPFALSCVEGLGIGLGALIWVGLPGGPHPNLPPAGGRDYCFGSSPPVGGASTGAPFPFALSCVEGLGMVCLGALRPWVGLPGGAIVLGPVAVRTGLAHLGWPTPILRLRCSSLRPFDAAQDAWGGAAHLGGRGLLPFLSRALRRGSG